jgi:phosphatidylserine/phosphatidylglycerophosphate/cardiolipin synthase-like enzyme
MAKFLNTSATNYYLEELIKQSRERLIIISPFLKFNDRIKELLTDKDRLKIDVRLVYGKSELAPREINWLRSLEFVRTSFCQNLHAKCYINEEAAIITSMNLYDFSQVNNNEMGVYIAREDEADLYRETFEEAQRLIRISEQVRLSAETIDEHAQPPSNAHEETETEETKYDKLTTSRLAKARSVKTGELIKSLVAKGYLERSGDQLKLTETGQQAGGEERLSKRFGQYFLWPADMNT